MSTLLITCKCMGSLAAVKALAQPWCMQSIINRSSHISTPPGCGAPKGFTRLAQHAVMQHAKHAQSSSQASSSAASPPPLPPSGPAASSSGSHASTTCTQTARSSSRGRVLQCSGVCGLFNTPWGLCKRHAATTTVACNRGTRSRSACGGVPSGTHRLPRLVQLCEPSQVFEIRGVGHALHGTAWHSAGLRCTLGCQLNRAQAHGWKGITSKEHDSPCAGTGHTQRHHPQRPRAHPHQESVALLPVSLDHCCRAGGALAEGLAGEDHLPPKGGRTGWVGEGINALCRVVEGS